MMNKTVSVLEQGGRCLAVLQEHLVYAVPYQAGTHYDYLVIMADDFDRRDLSRLKSCVRDGDQVLVCGQRVYKSRWPDNITSCGRQGDFRYDHVIYSAHETCCDFYAHEVIAGHCIIPVENADLLRYAPLFAIRYLEGEDL